jgi:hypothetical protein
MQLIGGTTAFFDAYGWAPDLQYPMVIRDFRRAAAQCVSWRRRTSGCGQR